MDIPPVALQPPAVGINGGGSGSVYGKIAERWALDSDRQGAKNVGGPCNEDQQ